MSGGKICRANVGKKCPDGGKGNGGEKNKSIKNKVLGGLFGVGMKFARGLVEDNH